MTHVRAGWGMRRFPVNLCKNRKGLPGEVINEVHQGHILVDLAQFEDKLRPDTYIEGLVGG